MIKRYNNLVYLIILLVAVLFLYHHRENFILFSRLNLFDLLILCLISLMVFFVISLQFRSLMRVFNVNLGFNEYFGISVCKTMFSYYLPFRGGTALRALYLKKKFGFLYSHYISLMIVSSLIIFGLSAVTGLLVSGLIYLNGMLKVKPLMLIFVFIFLLIIMGIFTIRLFIKLKIKTKRIENILSKIKDGISIFLKKRFSIVEFSLYQIVFAFLVTLRLFWCFKGLGINVNFWFILVIHALLNFSMILSITPGNLGIKEGIIAFAANIIGVPLGSAIMVAALDRIVAMTLTFAFGLIYSKVILKDIKFRDELDEKSKILYPGL